MSKSKKTDPIKCPPRKALGLEDETCQCWHNWKGWEDKEVISDGGARVPKVLPDYDITDQYWS